MKTIMGEKQVMNYFILILLMSVFVTACGQSSGSVAPTQTNAVEKPQETANPQPEQSKQDQPKPAEVKLTKLLVGYDGFSMDAAPLNYTFQKGIFEKYGLDVELVYIAGGSALTQALVGGNFDIAQNGYAPGTQAITSGADLVFVGGITNKLAFQFIVKPEITNAEQLKGKKIAISRFGSLTDVASRKVLDSLGIKHDEVIILQTGGTAERGAALMNGQVDATLEQHPQTDTLTAEGFKVLVELKDVAADYPNSAYVVTRDFLEKHPDQIKNYLMAMTEGIYEYKKNRDEAIKITAEFFKMEDVKALEPTYDFYTKEIFPDIPEPTLEGLKLVLEDVVKTKPEAASIKVEDIIDLTAIDELKKEGFFDKFK